LQDGHLKFVNDHGDALARLLDDPRRARRGQLALHYPVHAIVPQTFLLIFQGFVLFLFLFHNRRSTQQVQ
jgi:hypothetical protein